MKVLGAVLLVGEQGHLQTLGRLLAERAALGPHCPHWGGRVKFMLISF